jgi:DNA-binding CsgD family transcriptional regulator
MLNGVSATRRKWVKPPALTTSAILASPAWAPSASPTSWDSEPRQIEQMLAQARTGTARGELAATGETLRRRDPSTIEELTPQELQIALLLTAGRTTRKAAAAVFLSPKTVEYHLRHVYQKLGIHSRDELAEALTAQAAGPGEAEQLSRAATK